MKYAIDMKDLGPLGTIEIEARGYRRFLFALALAKTLFRLGAWLLNIGIVIKEDVK